MQQIEVTIMGQSYLLGCPEGGEPRLKEAVACVDKEMCAIRDAGKIRARDRIAVLASLNLAYVLTDPSSKDGAPSLPLAGALPAEEVSSAGDVTTATAASHAPVPSLTREDESTCHELIGKIDRLLGASGQLI